MSSQDKKIYGLIGYPVKHSLSPAMHNAAFGDLQIEAEYKLFEVKPAELENFLLKTVFAENISGFNITMPHKIKAREILEREFPYGQNGSLIQVDLYYVKLSGAINTVRRDGDKLLYWNTDASGFLESLKKILHFQTNKGKNVFIFGCGGAGRAIIAALSWKDVVNKIYINDINKAAVDSAKEYFFNLAQPHLKEKLEFISTENTPEIINNCDLLVNASPIGMEDADVSVIDKKLLHKNLSVYDIVYNRKAQTRLIRDAESLGLPIAEGLDMLLYQGERSFNLWTGKPAPIEIMRQALKGVVNQL